MFVLGLPCNIAVIKKNMKRGTVKIIALMMCVLMILSMAACSADSTKENAGH